MRETDIAYSEVYSLRGVVFSVAFDQFLLNLIFTPLLMSLAESYIEVKEKGSAFRSSMKLEIHWLKYQLFKGWRTRSDEIMHLNKLSA